MKIHLIFVYGLLVLFLFYMYVQCTVYLKKLNQEQSLAIYCGDFCVIIIGRVELLSLLLLLLLFFFLSFHFSFVDRTSN